MQPRDAPLSDDKLDDLLERVRTLFEKLQRRIATSQATSQRFGPDELSEVADGDTLLAMTNLLDGHADRAGVAKAVRDRRRSRYGSFPALRVALEQRGSSPQACANYDRCIQTNGDLIRRLARKRSGGLAHTQSDSASVTLEEVETLRNDLLSTFADIWYETYGNFPAIKSLYYTPRGIAARTALTSGHIHKITLGPSRA